jgi:hypothetical protein
MLKCPVSGLRKKIQRVVSPLLGGRRMRVKKERIFGLVSKVQPIPQKK